jgi:serine/threonine-protein kinase
MNMPFMKHLPFGKKSNPEVFPPSRLESAFVPVKPKMLGRYEIVREIGRGSMGVVYLGRDTVHGHEVALKTMNLAHEFNARAMDDSRERFLREAEFLQTLHHPDIVHFYSVGEDRGMAYIAMEFLTGVELTAHTEPGHLLPLPVTLEIIARTAEALAYAHEQNIVHRDVKPGNIMYDSARNMVKVADFGISRLTNLARTRTGLVLGSPLYMSPEQVLGEQITGLSDLFSLGATLYQLVSGRLPFEGETDLKVMYRIAEEAHTDILHIKPKLLPRLSGVINRALAKDMTERYQSGYEMAWALRQCAAAL